MPGMATEATDGSPAALGAATAGGPGEAALDTALTVEAHQHAAVAPVRSGAHAYALGARLTDQTAAIMPDPHG